MCAGAILPGLEGAMSAQCNSSRTDQPLLGARVLIMEDEFLVALALETALEEFGCRIVGPFATVEDGLASVSAEPLDAAVLDVNLRDGIVMPVALALRARGVPMMLHTSHSDPSALEAPLNGFARVVKPCSDACLKRELETLLRARLPPEAA